MYKVEIKTLNSFVSFEETDFSKAIQWAEVISLAEKKNHGTIKSINVFEKNKLIASLRTVK